ncbi:hypothetical protein A4X06_0g5442 [Tilletia controversa]|uniref:histone deacetylase n=1 Tax=Tilletia controversa TaxID=13291 RepID=A0A8X7MQP1_9BASI|nr:hypothetical protein A4X06_0g5442 [Tilletia controversa]
MSSSTMSSGSKHAGLSITMLAHAEAQQAAAGPSSSRLDSNSNSNININDHGAHPPLPAPGTAAKRRAAGPGKRVSYYYDSDVGAFSYGYQHPMKPHRMRMAHNLIQAYGLDRHMDVHRPKRATPNELTRFHTDEYVDFLRMVTPETVAILTGDSARHLAGAGEDCPAFEGLWDFCSISAGGSIGAAHQITTGNSDISVNWAGGLHHAKKREASGFCYVNDIVLCILELLRVHTRVLYIDIDVHHGDGVEEAFYSTDRVLTASFHKFGDFFPGTGDVKDTGMKGGKGYSVNVPLKDGITEEAYMDVFKPVMSHIMDWYRPGAVVLQCGADSLAGDKLGCFNLSMRGHAACVDYMMTYNVPLIILGGGGYTIRNVARTWTYETGAVLGVELSPDLPYNAYMSYFGPDYKLDVPKNSMEDYNSKTYLEDIKSQIIDTLRTLPGAPSAQMQEVPRGPLFGVGRREEDLSNDEDSDMDQRITERIKDAHIERYGDELSDDGEEDGEFYGVGPNPPNRMRLRPEGYEDESEDEVMYDGRIQDRQQQQQQQQQQAGSRSSRRGSSSSALVAANGASRRSQDDARAQALLPPVWREGTAGPPASSSTSSHPNAWNADPGAIVRAFPFHNPYSRHRPKRSFFSSGSRPSASLDEIRAALAQQGYTGYGGYYGAGMGGYGAGMEEDDEDEDEEEESGGGGNGGNGTSYYDDRKRERDGQSDSDRDRARRRGVGMPAAGGGRGGWLDEMGLSTGGVGGRGFTRDGRKVDASANHYLSSSSSSMAGGGGGGKAGRDRAKERERKAAREREWEQAREWRVAA